MSDAEASEARPADEPGEAAGAAGRRARRVRLAPLEWVALIVGLVLVIQYAWFMDDAFVYFRYVDNLLFLPYGLVYNAGEYVEGFSSPAWTLLLIALRSTGADWWLLTRLVGAISFVVFVLAARRVNAELGPADGPRFNLPLAFLAANYGVLCYFTSGLEGPLVHLAAAAYALLTLRPASRGLHVAIGFSPLVRQELLVAMAVAGLWSWRRTQRFPWAMAASAAFFCGGWLIFRVWYYADLLPNTFYLKDTSDYAQGLRYVWDTVSPYRLVWLLAGFAVMLVLARRGAGGPEGGEEAATGSADAARLAMLLFALPVAAYVVRIGGDPRHFRYLVFPFDLVVLAGGGSAEWLWRRRSWPASFGYGLAAVVLAGSLAAYPVELTAHPLRGGPPQVAGREVHKIKDAWMHRHDPTLAQPPWGKSQGLEQRAAYAAFLAETPAGTYIGVGEGTWCVTLYKAFNVRIVQSFGLTDAVLARVDAPAERPGHKHGLLPLARELAMLLDAYGEPGVGMYRAMVARQQAPPWIAANLAKLELIERKIYNRHAFWENLKLALTPVGRIVVE